MRTLRARSYKYVDVVPTHVHPNFDKLHWADIGDNYVPYNKPGSIKHWRVLRNATPSRARPTPSRCLPAAEHEALRSVARAWAAARGGVARGCRARVF